MKKAERGFNCVEMMHQGGLRIHEELKDKTREEQLAYWQRQDEEARKKHPRLRTLSPSHTVHK